MSLVVQTIPATINPFKATPDGKKIARKVAAYRRGHQRYEHGAP